ncbi:MAG: M48 family metallopeptidase [Vulcanibacillus sp.]
MKKFYIGFTVFILTYGGLIFLYLFNIEQALPTEYLNSSADPATFMTSEQINTSIVYSRIKQFIFFIGIPWEWAIYLIILALGFSTTFLLIAKKISKHSALLQTGIYITLVLLLVAILEFPVTYFAYKISTQYGINIQPFDLWLLDKGKSFLLDLIITIPTIWVLYWLIKTSEKRWWFWAWLISIPFIILMVFAQPVIIDPLFNDFQSLQDQDLKEDILLLAADANIPPENIFQVNMSDKTTAMNAYVTGIGGNARIVLWDTTLNKLNKEEILFITAHEIGHYVYKHIYWYLLAEIFLSLLMLYFLYKILNWLISRFGEVWGIKRLSNINSLPLILLVISLFSFIISPIENSVSRQIERITDAYAIKMTANKEAAISAFQKLSVNSLSDPNPPELVKIFLYSHPTIVERIYLISNQKITIDNDPNK